MFVGIVLVSSLAAREGASSWKGADSYVPAHDGYMDMHARDEGFPIDTINVVHPVAGLTRLHVAVHNGEAAAVQRLLKAGADPDVLTRRKDPGIVDTAVTELMLPNAEEGETALTIAANIGDHEIVDMLIAAGASVDLRNRYDSTPLFLAVSRGHRTVVRSLLAAGASVDRRSGVSGDGDQSDTPLTYAAYMGDPQTVNLLVKAGASVEARSQPGDHTALSLAVTHGGSCLEGQGGRSRAHDAVIEELIAAGANLNVRLQDGDTPLMLALASGCLHLLQALLRAGADPNLPSVAVDRSKATAHEGCTPLIAAAAYGEVTMCQMLLDAGASASAYDTNGFTAMDWALAYDPQSDMPRVRKGRMAVAQLLRERGAYEDKGQGFMRPRQVSADEASGAGFIARLVISVLLIGVVALLVSRAGLFLVL